MRIGQLAKAAAVNVQTLRFYEREGLLPPPARSRSGYREYRAGAISQVQFIRSCQEIGFTLADVKEVLELHRILALRDRAEGLKPRAQEKLLATANRRLGLIDSKLKILVKIKRDMKSLVATLQGPQAPVCPVSGLRVA